MIRRLLLLLFMGTLGCSGAIETGPAAYEHLKSLYQVTNQRDVEMLEFIAEKIATDRESGELSAAEAQSLQEIVSDARGGDWKAANKAARRLMEAQLRAG